MKKPEMPEGYTENSVVAIIVKISKRLGETFTLGYLGPEDIQQECFILGWKGLSKYNGQHPLEHFLYVHIRNRLLNLIRNKIRRKDPPCYTCHAACLEPSLYKPDHPDEQLCKKYVEWVDRNSCKASLMNSLSIGEFDTPDKSNDSLICPEFSSTIFFLLNKELSDKGRRVLERMRGGTQFKKSILQNFIEECRAIIEKYGIKWEDTNGYSSPQS